MPSFDISSKVDLQTLDNAINTVNKEISTRFDFKNSPVKIDLNKKFAGTTVVVTHFAPSLRSADPRYGLVPGTAGFCNALDALLPQAALWLHGHLHAPSDYMHHGCRVVANPLGYARKNEQTAFAPCLTLSI